MSQKSGKQKQQSFVFDNFNLPKILIYHFIIIAIGVTVVYGITVTYSFCYCWDDCVLFLDNENVKGLTWENIKAIWRPGKNPSFQPIRDLSYALDYTLFKEKPFWYHLENVIFYLLNCWLIYLIVWKISKNYMISFWSSLLFLLHPVHTEAVAWVTARKEVLMGMFFLLAFYFHINKNFLLAIIFFIASILAKPVAEMFPLIALAYDITFTSNFSFKKLRPYFKIYLMYFLLTAGFIATTLYVAQKGAIKGFAENSFIQQLTIVFKALFNNIKLTLYPWKLSPIYDFSPNLSWQDTEVLGGVIIALIVLIAGWQLFKRKSNYFFYLSWYFILLLPALNLFPIAHPVANRYLYLSVFAFCFVIGKSVVTRLSKKFSYALLGLISGIYLILSIIQVGIWKDDITLGKYSVSLLPDYNLTHWELGWAYLREKNYDAALQEFNKSIELGTTIPYPYLKAGYIYLQRGELDKALSFYKQALPLIKEDKVRKEAIGNIGVINSEKGNFAEAEYFLNQALKLDQKDPELILNLGVLRAKEGRFSEAETLFKQVIEISPNLAEAYLHLGTIYLNIYKSTYQACEYFKKFLDLDPTHPKAEEIKTLLKQLQNNAY